jgi:putative addiction module antidote
MENVMDTLKLTQIGNSVGVILPKEILAILDVDKGDTLTVTRTPGGISLRPHDEKFARHMEIAEQIMREDRDVLKKLAE